MGEFLGIELSAWQEQMIALFFLGGIDGKLCEISEQEKIIQANTLLSTLPVEVATEITLQCLSGKEIS